MLLDVVICLDLPCCCAPQYILIVMRNQIEGQQDKSYMNWQSALKLLHSARWHCSGQLWVSNLGATGAKSLMVDWTLRSQRIIPWCSWCTANGYVINSRWVIRTISKFWDLSSTTAFYKEDTMYWRLIKSTFWSMHVVFASLKCVVISWITFSNGNLTHVIRINIIQWNPYFVMQSK